jgi:hypothetical protein
MNAEYAAESFPTIILSAVKGAEDFFAEIAWFQTFPPATPQECCAFTVQEK